MCEIQDEINKLYDKIYSKEDFNIFEKLNLTNKELIHSKFIESVLNYSEEFFNLFFSEILTIKSEGKVTRQDFRDYKINVEHNLSSGEEKYGRADIWIGEKSTQTLPRKRIIIENKIYAGEQPKQLDRYHNYLNDNPSERDGWLFYLTLEGKNASKNSATQNKYHSISYDHIKTWLEKCQKSENAGVQIKTAISQYIAILDILTVKYRHANLLLQDDSEYKGPVNSKSKAILTEDEFYAALEYKFWMRIDEAIAGPFIEFRRYSYDKVYKRNVKNKIERKYGLIFQSSQSSFRISVDKAGNLSICSGSFDTKDNKWNKSEDFNVPFTLKFKRNKDVKLMIDAVVGFLKEKLLIAK